MIPLRVREVRESIDSKEFQAWYQQFNDLRKELQKAQQRLEEVQLEHNIQYGRAEISQRQADDTLFKAGELEDQASVALAEYTAIENASYESLSEFETQRDKASSLWYKVSSKDNLLEEKRQELSELIAASEAKERSQVEVNEYDKKRLEDDIEIILKELEALTKEQQEEEAIRDQLWVDVESAWSQSFMFNMKRAELQYRARKVRTMAEYNFELAEQERNEAERLKTEIDKWQQEVIDAEHNLEALLDKGQHDFQACISAEYIYWPRKEDVKFAYCVPLIEDTEFLNIQVKPLRIYQVERSRGLEFIEPFIEDVQGDAEADPRLNEFFG